MQATVLYTILYGICPLNFMRHFRRESKGAMESRLADGEELANDVKAEGEDDTNEAENERHKAEKQTVNESEDGTDEATDAVTEGNGDDDINEDLDISNDAEDETECTEDELGKVPLVIISTAF